MYQETERNYKSALKDILFALEHMDLLVADVTVPRSTFVLYTNGREKSLR